YTALLGAHRVRPFARVEATCRPALSHRCRIVRSAGAWYRVEQDRLVVGDSLRHESVPVGIADHAVEVRLSGVDAGRQLLIHNHLRGLPFPSAIGNPWR